jgi:FkbM family methyltransferase
MVWPAEDEACCGVIFDEVLKLEVVYPHITNWTACVQAGGNCGVFAMALSKKFTSVYTFEPDPTNFTCLAHNTNECENVYRLQAAVGSPNQTPIDLKRFDANCGAHQVEGNGQIPVLTIDNLNLPSCGLIYLDVEGFEYNALRGAIETIQRCRPVIVLEQKGIGNRYGMPDSELTVWLTSGFGYKLGEQIGKDKLYVP